MLRCQACLAAVAQLAQRVRRRRSCATYAQTDQITHQVSAFDGKVATLENGAKVAVPSFIKEGDSILIDPDTGTYIERA